MSKSFIVRTGSVAAAASLALLAAGPALAAPPVAQASATALTLSVAGNGTDSGTFTASHDGAAQTTTGTNTPAVTTMAGQRLTNLGTLAQDATTVVDGGAGSSAACSGVAGEGATVVQAGDGSSCLRGGRTVTLEAGNVELENVQVADDEALRGLDPGVTSLILGPVSDALETVLTGLGSPGLYLDLGAVQAVCTAGPGSAQGAANIADGALYLQGPGVGRVDLVDLPLTPAPNHHVVTDLSGLLTLVQDGLDSQLTALATVPGLSTVLDGLGLGLDAVVEQIKGNVTDTLGPQLAPVEQNLLDLTLNQQRRPADNAITVTALELRVLPAAAQFIDADLVTLSLGTVSCGPNGRVAAPAVARSQPVTSVPGDGSVPTGVTAGAADFESDPTPVAFAALAGLVLAGIAAAAVGFRRGLRQ